MTNRLLFIPMLVAATISLAGFAGQSAPARPQELSKKDLHALIKNAKAPADHRKLADYYRQEVLRLSAEQKEHQEMGREYDAYPMKYPTKYPTPGDHCRSLAGYYGSAAQNAAQLAKYHEKMAVQLEK